MSNYLIRNKMQFIDMLRQLRIVEYVNAEECQTLNDLFVQIDSHILKEDLLRKLQYHLMLYKLLGSLPNQPGNPFDNTFLDLKLYSVFKTDNAKEIKDCLYKTANGWQMPTSILKTSSFVLSFTVFVFWSFLVFTFFRLFPDVFVVTFNVFSISLLLLILVLPEIVLRFLLPNKFGAERFIGVKTLRELIAELNTINKEEYIKNAYVRMKDEMHALYGPF